MQDYDDLVNSLGKTTIKCDITYDELLQVAKSNTYAKSCVISKKKDFNSLSYLVDKTISQSTSIKLGIAMEKIFCEIITKNTDFINIKEKNKKGIKEKDHLFMDIGNKVIYFAELKANINLDSEKSKATCTKCKLIYQELIKQYPDYTVKWFLLAYRYTRKEEIPSFIKNKYTEIGNNLTTINDYFTELGIPFSFSTPVYKKYINDVLDIISSSF